MKRLLTILCLTAALAAPAFADEPSDVTLIRADGTREEFRAEAQTPEAVYKLLEEVCEQRAAHGRVDSVILHGKATGGRFDILDLSRLAYFGGDGQDKSLLLMTAQHDNDGPTPENRNLKPGNPAIELGQRGPRAIRIRHITLKNVCHEITEDGALIGWGANGIGDVEFQDVTLDGSSRCDWLIYSWKRGSFRLVLDRCRLFHCRMGVALCESNTHYQVTMKDSQIVGDANKSFSFSETSGPDPNDGGLLGNVVRGRGTWIVDNCDFWMRGLKRPYNSKWTVPRIAALTNHFHSVSNPNLHVYLTDVRIRRIEPGLAKLVYDLDFRFGVIPIIDHSRAIHKAKLGTGPNGTFRMWTGR